MPAVGGSPPHMFAYLLTAVVVTGGTWLIYRHVFDGEPNDDEYEEVASRPALRKQESEEVGYPLRIFYGSQSGTAEGFSFDLKKEGKRLGFGARVIDLEDYDPEDLKTESFVVFLVATYGEGEPTDNAQEFYEWLSDEARESDEMDGVNYAVFGLGNSQYEFFNEMGKQFDERMANMGATRLVARGEGDDDTGEIEEQFAEWVKTLWPIVCEKFLNKIVEDTEEEFAPSLGVEIVENDEDVEIAKSVVFPFCGPKIPRKFRAEKRHKWVDSSRLATVRLKKEARLDTRDGSTLHIEFDISNIRNFRYHTAHNLGIIPRNDYKTAASLCKRLNVHPDAVVSISRLDETDDSPLSVPSVIRARDLFVWYYDINAYPRKGMLAVLRDLASDPEEAKAIEELLNQHDAKCWTFSNLLDTFQSVEIDMPTAMELLRPVQPRLFTISSSVKAQPEAVTITAKIERDSDHSVGGEEFFGLCSRYLHGLREGDQCQVYVQESHFDLPARDVPVIMVGPGTGLAPFRAFIQERSFLFQQASDEAKEEEKAPWYLYYGCRWSDVDYIYKDELEAALDQGVLSRLRVAFSRDNPDRKVYVQDLIAEDGEEIWDLVMNQNAKLFICGATSMGSGVRAVLRSIIAGQQSVSEEEADKILANLLSKKRIIQELWGA